ncbi:MAG: TRAM domain-containing protein, partial [Lachnospiraceae bacterium]|nr:TRAM domain-containing protein [Lachnospiraceae bacterium]
EQEENQVPEDIVKDRFNRLLTLLNNISNERISRYAGETKDILVEEINHQDSSLLTGRTEENITVHFKGDSSLIGEIIKVKLIECRGFYYIGERI